MTSATASAARPGAARAAAPSAAGAETPPGLVWVSDQAPGIRRIRVGDGFAYVGRDGKRVRKAAELNRIRALAIPPAYEDVWICVRANGHLQATGRDARGRKQYRYHPDWRVAKDADKFERMLEFGAALPRIRKRVAADLAAPVGTRPRRETVLATIVRLLDTTYVRIGNEEYARTNRSFGLTTLRNRHAAVSGDRLRLRFRGKSGKEHEVALDDPRVAKVVRRCQAMPGQDLFQYVDEEDVVHGVGSADVNDYIRGRRRRLHGQGLPHLARHGARIGALDRARQRRRRGAERQGAARRGREAARQHGRRLQEVVRASARARCAGERARHRAPRRARQGVAPRRPECRRAPPARLPVARLGRRALAKPVRPAYTITYRSVDDVSARPGQETPPWKNRSFA